MNLNEWWQKLYRILAHCVPAYLNNYPSLSTMMSIESFQSSGYDSPCNTRVSLFQ